MAKYNIGISPITGNVYIGRVNKKGNKWLEKEDVTDYFNIIALNKYTTENEKIPYKLKSISGKSYEIYIKEVKEV